MIITEGETDEEFYKEVISTIKKVNNGIKFKFDKIKYICAKSITRIHKKMLSRFEKDICTEFADWEKVVCFCYDSDVFEMSTNPPIDREKVKRDFLKAGASDIIEIVAERSIEDFFLYDIEGVKRYLGLPSNYKVPNDTGIKVLEKMFKDKNRIYYKGERVEGLVKKLDIKLIFSKICHKLSKLCLQLGCKCNGEKCKNNNNEVQ